MRTLPALLVLLLTAPAAAESTTSRDDDLARILTWIEATLPEDSACVPPGGPPPVQCVRERLHQVCERLHDCRAVCDSFVPGFDTIELPRYDSRREIVYGSMLAVDVPSTGTLFGIIRYEIHVGLSFNVDC